MKLLEYIAQYIGIFYIQAMTYSNNIQM